MDLLVNVLRSPMSFFESTPSGNLLNRFAKEIDAIDCMVPEGLKMMLSYVFKLLEVCIIVLMATPFAAVIILPLAFLYAFVQVPAAIVPTNTSLEAKSEFLCCMLLECSGVQNQLCWHKFNSHSFWIMGKPSVLLFVEPVKAGVLLFHCGSTELLRRHILSAAPAGGCESLAHLHPLQRDCAGCQRDPSLRGAAQVHSAG